MFNLGWLCETGQAGGQDHFEARHWYQKAADANNTAATYRLAILTPESLAQR
jgi:TPR repeat protein